MKKIVFILLLLSPILVLAKDTCDSKDIIIKSIVLKDTNGFAEEKDNSTINNNTINLNLKMYDIGDSATYNITIENNSNEEYYFTKDSFKIDHDYLEYSLKNNSEVIPAKSEKTVELKVTYKNKIPNESYSGTNKLMISLSDKPLDNPKTNANYYTLFIIFVVLIPICIKYHKKGLLVLSIFGIVSNVYAICTVNINVETKIEIENKEAIFLPGKEVNIKMKQLAGDDTSTVTYGYTFPDQLITSIKYSGIEPVDSNKEEKNIVSVVDSPYPIYMWYEEGTIYWWSEDSHPNLNEDSSYMLSLLKNLSNISSLSMWDSSDVINMNSMFFNTKLIDFVNLKKWNTSKLEKMNYTFFNNDYLVYLSGLEDWDTSNVTTMNGTFSANLKLKDMTAIKNWNVSKVENMSFMFSTCLSLEEIDLSKWSTPQLKNISSMFTMGVPVDPSIEPRVSKLKNIILSDSFDTSNVTDMSSTFYNIPYLEDYSFLKYLNTSNVKNMFQLFNNNDGLTNTEYVKNWNVSKVENMHGIFIGTSNLTSLEGLKHWNTASATDMGYMFRNSTSIGSLSGMENWNVANVTSFNCMFDGATSLTDATAINNWDVSPNATFSAMFRGTQSHPEFTKVQGTWTGGTFTPTP